jgi:hypothetical protein
MSPRKSAKNLRTDETFPPTTINPPKARRSYSGLTICPDDENGDALRNIAAQGDDLTKPRDIDFTVVFAQAGSAEQFAEHFRERG